MVSLGHRQPKLLVAPTNGPDVSSSPHDASRSGNDVDVASLSTDTLEVLLWLPQHPMDGITQRKQQSTLPPGSGGDIILIMHNGQLPVERDWTEDLPKTDHVRFFRETDWSKSKLGPLNTWSPTLRLFTGFVLADSRAACLWWYVMV